MRSDFSLEDFEAYKKTYWLMPTAWSDPRSTLIAELKRHGGAAAVSILPWLGRIAATPNTQPWAISAEELARVCGVDSKGIRKARIVLSQLGHGSAEVKQRYGARLLHWHAKPHLVARAQKGYFYFSFRVLYGGHWSELSAVQRAIYLAAGTLASVYRDEVEKSALYPVLARGFPLYDIEKSRRFGCEKPNEYRLACASYADLSRISGYELSTVKRAVQDLKHPCWRNLATRMP